MTENHISNEDRVELEQKALRISTYGALVLALLGIGFAFQSGSDAILLDGVFSLLGFFMALMTIQVARLVRRPDDEIFQYGYAHFAPLMNVLKSLVMTVLCGFAFFSAINTLLDGGGPMAVGSALIYAVCATMIGAGLFLYLGKVAEQTASPLVSLDAKAARVDMFLSAAVLVSFGLGWLSLGTSMQRYLDYLDPAVVALLCLVALPVPLKVLWSNSREVLLLAPDSDVQEAVKEQIAKALESVAVADYRIRMLKLGNVMSVTLHLKLSEDHPIKDIRELDTIRMSIEDALSQLEHDIGLDVMFVHDMKLARK